MSGKEQAFIEKLYECNQHKQKLLVASKRLSKFIPLNLNQYEKLSEEDISFIDQLIYRFSKLQDTLGDKLFPSFLELIGEEARSKPFIDRLNRIEELGLVNKNEWMELRKDRNEIAHEYSNNKEEIVIWINIIYNDLTKLLNIYDVFYNYCINKFEFVSKSTVL